jgi:DNA mismatch repair ATPase MutS
MEALESVAYLDILLAKALQANALNLCKPVMVSENTFYEALFNPPLKDLLAKQNKKFQPIDICLYESPCLITGANMAGKTVVLKTIALAQYLFQFGFFIPAVKAEIVPMEDVMLSIGDNQSEMNGLSSFAAEMLNVNTIIKAVHSKKKILALIDELARTTNPDEGKAIVNATIDILEAGNIRSLITTHYSDLNSSCRRLRVKGLITEQMTEDINIQNINDYMDYSLVENNDDVVPMEALRIAAILGIDEDLLERADQYMLK